MLNIEGQFEATMVEGIVMVKPALYDRTAQTVRQKWAKRHMEEQPELWSPGVLAEGWGAEEETKTGEATPVKKLLKKTTSSKKESKSEHTLFTALAAASKLWALNCLGSFVTRYACEIFARTTVFVH
jgi:hypothetical protein